ncbi:aminoacyl-tRNA hydrolase [Caldalkalibacillus salinus]|uniref:aminoacyl-tRNA hydrolase n=1 Tax=Caldalkalibacillus salinus TaxID=2803787 RepID=UPI001922F109|nr:aminoacyl-tRNA hydrolase [Caldalkalibacillus salinus]
MKLIVGLGNPGPKYEDTRHNIGFMVIDHLARALNIEVTQNKGKGLVGEGLVEGQKVMLVKPMTYMNLSGECVRALMDYYKIPIDDVLIIYDDLDLPFAKFKLRMKGSSAGHNGLKSIIAHLGTQAFQRVKMGIGRPEYGDIIPYVLGKFAKEEQKHLQPWIEEAGEASLAFVTEPDFSKVMNRFNR